MDKRQSRITVLICLLISAIVVYFGMRSRSQPTGSLSAIPSVPDVQASQLTTVGSPDGKFTLTMKQEKGTDTLNYRFLVTDESTSVQKEILTKNVPLGTTLSIPANTFSSDNKYVFLQENGGAESGYIVLAVSGASIGDSQTLNVSSLFIAKHSNYVITGATGWAGPTLLVINTDKVEGGRGPSFWFDVASKSFIQLSTRFN